MSPNHPTTLKLPSCTQLQGIETIGLWNLTSTNAFSPHRTAFTGTSLTPESQTGVSCTGLSSFQTDSLTLIYLNFVLSCSFFSSRSLAHATCKSPHRCSTSAPKLIYTLILGGIPIWSGWNVRASNFWRAICRDSAQMRKMTGALLCENHLPSGM